MTTKTLCVRIGEMDKSNGIYKICEAMLKAGIKDPESQEGKDFCTKRGKFAKKGGCPYTSCIVFEGPSKIDTRMARDVKRAKEMRAQKIPAEKIAKELGKDVRTILRYLER